MKNQDNTLQPPLINDIPTSGYSSTRIFEGRMEIIFTEEVFVVFAFDKTIEDAGMRPVSLRMVTRIVSKVSSFLPSLTILQPLSPRPVPVTRRAAA